MWSNGQNRLMEDMARIVTDVAGVAEGAGREMKTAIQHRMEQFIQEMDVVPREEFEVLRDMMLKANEHISELEARIEKLETPQKRKNAAPSKK